MPLDFLNYFYNFITVIEDNDIETITIIYYKYLGFKVSLLSMRVTDNRYSTLAVTDKKEELDFTVIIILGILMFLELVIDYSI